jgi:hypothetical protein
MAGRRDRRRWRRKWREKEEKERRRKKKKEVDQNVMYPKGANEGDALLWSKGASKGDALLSTVTRAAATSTPQGASESGALLCTKDVRYLGALQSGPYMEYVSVGLFVKKIKRLK